ncbi:hypothetical protein RMR21_015685 [Agrobacterium sp. rho-8.1]|nr:hypothetical protein [Agrobacterium sp. rho-8.1]
MFDLLELLKRFQEEDAAPQGTIATAQPPQAVPQPQQQNLLSRFLPQDEDKRDALSMFLLNAGAGMMAAGGPSTTPVNFGSAVGKGLGAGAQAYTQARKDAADGAVSRAKVRGEQVKLLQAQDAQDFASSMPTSGDGAYSVPDLKKLYQRYLAMGEYSAANTILERIQRLDDERRKDGLVQGPGGDYELAGGVAEGANEMERQKSAGRVEGEELFKKTDDIREYEYGQDDPAFKTQQAEKTNAGRQANRLQKTGAYIDPKSSRRFNGYFDSATGRTVYMDASNNPVDDPDVIDRMVEDTPGRTKANMSDPVVKDERSAEAALAQAAGRSQSTVGVIDRMEGLSNDINTNSWFGTGGYNSTAKMLDTVLPGDNFSGSKRQELDNLMQEQIKQEIESLRGLGAMSDRDLAAIQDRVLNGSLNPDALEEIANRMRKISTYNASKYQAWKDSGQNDEFRQWSFKYDNDKYEGFMNPKKEQKQVQSNDVIVTGGDGVQYRFKGGDRNKKENWEPIL